MTVLWVSIALMTVIMLLFFVLPLSLARKSKEEVDLSALNTGVFNEHLKQLEQDFSDKLIEQVDYELQKRELEERYIHDMDGIEKGQSDVTSSRSTLIGLLVVGLIASVSAVSMYYKLGATDELEMAESMKAVSGLSEQELLTRLEQQLSSDPDNLEGQLLLARTYLTLGRMADAIQPLKLALELSENSESEAMIAAQLAQSIYFSDTSVITSEAENLIDRALELDPQEPTALGVSGIFAFEQGDYQKAVQQWQKILALVEDGPNADSLRQGIKTAQMRLQEQGIEVDSSLVESTTEETATNAVSSLAIRVAVGIEDGLASEFSPETRVFIYARHAQGPRMPLAIQSLAIKDLPVLVQLDDTTSMAGMAKLSDAQAVQVVARVSTSGTAMPSEGYVEVLSKSIQMSEIPEIVVLELKR